MRAAQAAQSLRNTIKKLGINPKGMVRVISTDYTTEIEVDLAGIYEEDVYQIEQAINDLDSVNFSWNVQ